MLKITKPHTFSSFSAPNGVSCSINPGLSFFREEIQPEWPVNQLKAITINQPVAQAKGFTL